MDGKPKWDEAGRVHDWRNHVPEEIKILWDALTWEAREVAFFMACQEADMEVWD